MKLGACGARVAVNYHGSADKAERVAEQVLAAGGQGAAFKADVRDEAQVAAMVRDVAASSAGRSTSSSPTRPGPQPFVKIEDLTWQACLDQLEFFVKSPMLLMKAVVGPMKERRFGRVINIGSEVFEKGVPEFSNYVSARARARADAVVGDGTGEVRHHGEPRRRWWIPTERVDDPQDMKDAYAAVVPMGHMGVPQDIAEAVAFLASDARSSSPARSCRSTAGTRWVGAGCARGAGLTRRQHAGRGMYFPAGLLYDDRVPSGRQRHRFEETTRERDERDEEGTGRAGGDGAAQNVCVFGLGIAGGCDQGSDTSGGGGGGQRRRRGGGHAGQRRRAGGEPLKLAFVTNNASEFWKIAAAGVRKYEDEGKVQVDVKMPPNGTAEEQNRSSRTSSARGTTPSPSARSPRRTRSAR